MQKAGNKKVLLTCAMLPLGTWPSDPAGEFPVEVGNDATLEGQKVEKQTFVADASKAINTTAPVVVLVNRGRLDRRSWCGALLDNKRATWSAKRRLAKALNRRRLNCRTVRR